MKLLLEYGEFSQRESKDRIKTLSVTEFLDVLNKECKNFSFENDELIRLTNFQGDEYSEDFYDKFKIKWSFKN